jgi:hypothetical protein
VEMADLLNNPARLHQAMRLLEMWSPQAMVSRTGKSAIVLVEAGTEATMVCFTKHAIQFASLRFQKKA